jgi:polysaccharide pyruvyl transferase WcaK-like protein
VEELQNILAQRKTSGSNYIGVWEKDTKSPIGNRMHALIMRLQKERGGKGNEYRTKFETIYDPLEPAKKAAQQRYKDEQKRKKVRQ